jgi:ribosomal protein S18 acetylase RimI-like enzyme
MIRLVTKSPTDLKAWMVTMWAVYRQDLLDAGSTAQDSDSNVARNREVLFHGDEPADGQYFFDVLSDDVIVGTLWLADKKDKEAKDWYIYYIVVDEQYRGQGFGRLIMRAAEDYVKGQGGKRLALNVFGPNTAARSLYESMDYQVMAVSMYKDFS